MQVPGLSLKYDAKVYFAYNEAVVRKATALSAADTDTWTPHMVAQALWAEHAIPQAPSLTKRPRTDSDESTETKATKKQKKKVKT